MPLLRLRYVRTVHRFPLLDYLKLGPYDERLGGLDKSTTNQRFYRIEAEKLIDETYLFRRKEAELHEQR